jgi:N utilization substance protein B
MRKRTKSRECALQILYTIDISGDDPQDIIKIYWENHRELSPFKDFANTLVEGVSSYRKEIDELINTYAQNWKLSRMAVVDRNILRISTFELLYLNEIPPKVSINEAVNLAKKFSTADSGKFVNGILDKIHKERKIAEG